MVDMPGGARDYMLDFVHGEIGMRTPMLAKPAAIGQMPAQTYAQLYAARNNAEKHSGCSRTAGTFGELLNRGLARSERGGSDLLRDS
jgi:hypothetical protein